MPNNRNNILVDPRGEYYHDAYPAQQQEPPGLESRMQPRPDTGEESYRGHGRLLGRKALITGGDSGIGRAVAIAFAREGADIAVNYLPAEQPDAASLRTLLDSEGSRLTLLPGDLSDEQSCPPHRPRRRPRTRRARHSGAQRRHAARRQGDRAPLDRTTGIYLRHQRLLALLERTGGASPHGSRRQYHHHFFDPGFPAVVVPDRLRRIEKRRRGVHPGSLAKQLAPKGIRVNSVAPGPVWTPLQVSGAQQPENIPGFGSRTPLGRAGQPVEVAPSYVFLASEESSYITAQIIGVTGGRYIL